MSDEGSTARRARQGAPYVLGRVRWDVRVIPRNGVCDHRAAEPMAASNAWLGTMNIAVLTAQRSMVSQHRKRLPVARG